MTFQSCRNSANKDLRLLCALLLSVPLLFTSACGGGGGSTPPVSPTITSVSVSCTPTSVQTGQTSQCSATVSGTGSYSSAVTWSAVSGTISSSGLYTAPATVPASGSDTVKATSTQDSTKSGTASITVATPTALAITISDLPTGTLANVTLTDPNGQKTTLTSSQTVSAIPGNYTVAAAPVVVGTSTYHATLTTQTVAVTSGSTSTAVVDYYNIIPNTTKVLDQTGALGLVVSSGGSTLTISSASEVAQSLKPGDVLVSAPTTSAPNGLLVKVTAATNSGSSIVVTSTPATLADEVTQAHFGVDIPFLLPNGSPAVQKHAGYAIRTGSLATPQVGSLTNPCAAAQSLSMPFSYSLTPDQNQNTLTASGELDFCNLHIDFEITPLSTTAKATVSLQQYSSLVVQGQYSTSFNWNEPLDLSALQNQVVCLGNETCQAVQGLPGSIGNALEVITPSITPFVGMTGAASGGLYLGGAESGSFQAGAQIQGVTASPIFSGTLQQQSYPTAVDGTLDVKGYFGVTLGFTLLGSVTAHVDPRAYAELAADTSANPWWTLSLGDEADAGLTLSFLGFGSSEHDTPEYTIYSSQLAQASGPYSGLPTLDNVTPSAATQYGSSLTLSLTGTNFVPGCYATFNGTPLATTYSDPTSLTAILPASLLGTPGSYSVAVTNSNVTGTTSNTLPFTVTATTNNPIPTIKALLPASLAVGATPQTLTINGTGFLSSSTVTFNGISRTAAFISATQLTISLTSADLATAGTYPVVVTNPAPGGGTSGSVIFTVTGNSAGAGEWTWIGGSSTSAGPIVWGTQGVPSVANNPGARDYGVSWIDTNDNFWIFGGNPNYSSDLWEYDPALGTWTWISGSNLTGQPAVFGTQGIPSTTNTPGALRHAVSWMGTDGNFWLYGGSKGPFDYLYTGSNFNSLWKFDPSALTWTWVSGSSSTDAPGVYGALGTPAATNTPGARIDSISWTDANGRLWLFGGDGYDSLGNGGLLNDLWTFDPSAGTWTWVSGSSTANVLPSYGTQGVPSASNVPGARDSATGWIDANGRLWLFGGEGYDSTGTLGLLNDLWTFDPSLGTWTWVSGSSTANALPVYGTQGVPAASNIPGARMIANSWIDSSGKAWLFGGYGTNFVDQYGIDMNDFWRFDPATGLWTWFGGTSTLGAYGTQGVPAVSNLPALRSGAVAWTDANGNLWLFSGGNSSEDLNDIWRYQP